MRNNSQDMILHTQHTKAMDLADEADLLRKSGLRDRAKAIYKNAFELERQVAEALIEDVAREPARSVFLRSAASLAIDCGLNRDAERMIAHALAGNPPDDIADELRNLFEQANFKRHLAIRKYDIEENDLKITFVGHAISYGVALFDSFVGRMIDIKTMVLRTVERTLERPFGARIAKKDGFDLFCTAPEPSSFAFSIRIGGPETLFSEMNTGAKAIAEFMDCMQLLSDQEADALHNRIRIEDYYQNFLALAKKIAPDKDKINYIGFSARQDGKERIVPFALRSRQIGEIIRGTDKQEEARGETEVTGTLLFADATKSRAGQIKICPKNGNAHNVTVPKAIMEDIVRPMFGQTVRAVVRHEKHKSHLISIDPIEISASDE
ncbi:MAG: hypothetical protein NTX50_02995 [Candidatus Sumerlaeota bacterium]|nr:hypothetical protein [Candidatus Sumerlaeota bacterium]